MTDALSHLKDSLASRYAIDRELGSGGMARRAVGGRRV